METTATPTDRFDAIDREKFRDMIESDTFKIFAQRVSRELVRAMTACERSDEPRDIYRAQGAAQMIEVVLMLPQQILKEMTPPAPAAKKR